MGRSGMLAEKVYYIISDHPYSGKVFKNARTDISAPSNWILLNNCFKIRYVFERFAILIYLSINVMFIFVSLTLQML